MRQETKIAGRLYKFASKVSRSEIYGRANFILVSTKTSSGSFVRLANDLTKLLESTPRQTFVWSGGTFPWNLLSERAEDTRTAASKNFADPYPGSLVLSGVPRKAHKFAWLPVCVRPKENVCSEENKPDLPKNRKRKTAGSLRIFRLTFSSNELARVQQPRGLITSWLRNTPPPAP